MEIQSPGFDARRDVIIVGGGHAGVEAAHAVARMGLRAALITLDIGKIALMPCNPAIGGLAKGQLTREIDALGGVMAKAIDATGIQFRMLNTRKGPAVRSPRAQADKPRYAEWVRRFLQAVPGLEIIEGMATAIMTGGAGVEGLILEDGRRLAAGAVVVCSGTFMDGLIHIGLRHFPAGRVGEKPSVGLGDNLASLGLETGRLKTGTPARLHKDSIDWDALEVQPGDENPQPFSFETEKINQPQVPCHITWTNAETHRIIAGGLDRSPLFTGVIKGAGPRYCPSIEDKIHRFADRERHQIFLEPESLGAPEIYPNGISTSLPEDVQEAFIHTIHGLERAKLIRPGYAVEYTYCPPRQLSATLEVKAAPGLFFAGQINATSGYEEAGAQGIMAGINAALKVKGEAPLTLRRDEAYIGVLIDDLITKDHREPYRMFTSRAEYRLALRHDTADLRLTPHGRRAGMIPDARWERFERRRDAIRDEIARLESARPAREALEAAFQRRGLPVPEGRPPAGDLLSRPDLSREILHELGLAGDVGRDESEQAYLHFRYAGYLRKERAQVERFLRLEDKRIPGDFNYESVRGLRHEARACLIRFRPGTLGQASRIAGVNPADVSLLLVALKAREAA